MATQMVCSTPKSSALHTTRPASAQCNWHYPHHPQIARNGTTASSAAPATRCLCRHSAERCRHSAERRGLVLSRSAAVGGSNGTVSVAVEEGAEGPKAFEENGASPAVVELSAEAKVEAKRKLWFAAIKPPMYTVSIVPVLVGAALAYQQTGALLAGRCAVLILGSILIIAWLNLSTGVDGGKPESVVNLTGNRKGVLLLANAFLAAGGALLWRTVSSAGDSRVGPMLGAAVAMGYLYQGPPFRLSYKGLGEPLCFAAFGPLATTAFYLCQVAKGAAGRGVPPAVWAAAAAVGVTVTTILFCSHFHQIDGDTAAGKMSPLVRLGPANALKVLKAATFAPYLILGGAVQFGALHYIGFLAAALFSVLPGRALLSFAQATHLDAERVTPLKRYAIKWHTAFGAGLCAGLCLSARFV